MSLDTLDCASVFFAGLLAGEEFVIRFGVRGPLARLEQRSHIEMRQGLIRTLRVLVPLIFAAAFMSGVAATFVHWSDGGMPFRLASLALLVAFILITLFGTVPINKAASNWDASNPPQGWEAAIRRWESLDNIRTVLALAAFALVLTGLEAVS
jgi:uncharacterized membrane protein